jgi:hypothetical protein
VITRHFEFHDSVLQSVIAEHSTVTLQLSPAYIHQWERRGDEYDGTGWAQDLSIRFSNADLEGTPCSLPESISDGELSGENYLDEGLHKIGTPISGNISLKLTLKNAATLVINGSAMETELLGNPRFIEKLPADFQPEEGAA